MKNRKSIWFIRREDIALSITTITTKEKSKEEEGVHESIGLEGRRRGIRNFKPAGEETSLLITRNELSPNWDME